VLRQQGTGMGRDQATQQHRRRRQHHFALHVRLVGTGVMLQGERRGAHLLGELGNPQPLVRQYVGARATIDQLEVERSFQ
jgi:hypothetical protein